eukprot:GEMP01045532.1.p1 GENE.GEMP01045532.1~~GEMP01045532.1.p1  ORF type:complete len:195 (+),score=41.01 GEMP01045532.1:76-585(+)
MRTSTAFGGLTSGRISLIPEAIRQTIVQHYESTALHINCASLVIATVLTARLSEVGAPPLWISLCTVAALWMPIGAHEASTNSRTAFYLWLVTMFFFIQTLFLSILFFAFVAGGPILVLENIMTLTALLLSLTNSIVSYQAMTESWGTWRGGVQPAGFMPLKKYAFSPY